MNISCWENEYGGKSNVKFETENWLKNSWLALVFLGVDLFFDELSLKIPFLDNKKK